MAGHRGASTWAAWCSSSHRKDNLVRGAWGRLVRQQNLEVLSDTAHFCGKHRLCQIIGVVGDARNDGLDRLVSPPSRHDGRDD
jgi:hypothetical protein